MSDDNVGRLLRIEEKLDKLTEKLHETNVTLARNTESLIIHEKRTDLAEQKLTLLEREFSEHSKKDDIVLNDIQLKLEPIYNHVNLVNIVVKYIIPAVSGIILFLVKLDIFK
jgi:hypothetical protein